MGRLSREFRNLEKAQDSEKCQNHEFVKQLSCPENPGLQVKEKRKKLHRSTTYKHMTN